MNKNDGIYVTNCDDWEAIYINGKLRIQSHSIPPRYYRAVKGSIYRQEISSEYTYEVGYLPADYDDIPSDAFLSEPELIEEDEYES